MFLKWKILFRYSKSHIIQVSLLFEFESISKNHANIQFMRIYYFRVVIFRISPICAF